ncbi:MAG: VCBS repeat-containing protein [Opitutaceae bacterium]|nr:VCBS repeat-containing protein [Opitutaceae bacterium]
MMPVRPPSSLAGLACLLLPVLPLGAADASRSWTDTGPGFAAGTLGNTGQNLYVNRRGELETIRRYDIDGNGWLDLFFNSTHDTYNALPATLATAASGESVAVAGLGVDGSSRVIPSDLNRDGFTDLVFMPNRQNIQKQRSSVAIAWGAADGWSTSRLTRQLPLNGATSLDAGDLNGDGWPDLISVNSSGWLHGQGAGNIVRVFWGGADGFFLAKYQDLGVPEAIEVAAGRFGPQRDLTAAVLTAAGNVHYLAAGPDGRLSVSRTVALPATAAPGGAAVKPRCLALQPGTGPAGDSLWIGTDGPVLFRVGAGATDEVTAFPARPATHVALGRLDDDAWTDVVLTDLKLVYPLDKNPPDISRTVTVLWGAADGVSLDRSSTLAIANAYGTAIGDLNADGHGDLAVSVYQGAESMKASSFVHFGTGGRQLPAAGVPVATEGAQGVAIVRVAPQAKPTAVFANSQRATLDSAVPVRLYWGSAAGFSPDAKVDLPNLSGYKSSLSDLNGDGHVDLVVINGGDVGPETLARAPDAGLNIYWGGSEGSIRGPGPTRFDPARRQVLHDTRLGSINVADLNGDGYLDLVTGAFEGPPQIVDGSPRYETHLVIYPGSAEGFSESRRQVLPVPDRSIGCLIADFNRDGRLDIIIGGYLTNQVITFWGGADGYRLDRQTSLPYTAPIDLEAADFNGDGWLDLVVASYEDRVSATHDSGLSIFWGGPGGWKQSASQWLPAMTPVGIAVADVDGDGFLDLVSPHYHGELSREQLPSYIFWGSAEGFAARRRTSLIVDSASEVTIADFDQDGKLDLAFAAHSVDPGHVVETPIFYNDGKRFQSPRVTWLPVIGPHYGWVQDIGNIVHRRNEENFTSRVHAWTGASRGGRIAVDAAAPHGARVRLQVRSAADAAGLEAAPWRPVAGDAFDLAAGDRALQYRLDLLSANGDAYPVVRKVSVQLK